LARKNGRGRYVMAVYLEGIGDVKRNISRWEAKKMLQVKELVKKTAQNIRRNARRRVPVKSGQLRKSIVIHYSSDRTAAFIRAVAPHSHLIEFGTARGLPARPFMQPAFDGQKSKYQQALNKIFEEV
jgi:HK97 gp10 family phage protein